ncbi:hypothetical protein EV356DRAFT_496667 [Viridothelium virens]|uniref:Ubiquitin-like domain-containing protein n=1 Tax=Viridothelium virens TaxID=1048519 RepID=A0A6A6HG88_VIRVR|nr:hypothetical protein EV356DRAFT_496667 [Viridothelium virens]
MAPITPSPLTWTIRFKCHKTTVLLHLDPTQSFSSIKAELLRALQESHPDGINGTSLPLEFEDILLARPNDPMDANAGWTGIDNDAAFVDDDEDGEPKKGKGKGKGKGKTGTATDCMQGAGFKNGGCLAFKFKNGDADDWSDIGGVGDEKWDVLIPSYEDQFDVRQEGDVGVRPEYRG